MGFWSTIKSGVKGLGKIAQKAAPVVGMIPGVGTLAAAGIGAAGGLLADGNIGSMLKGAAAGAGGSLLAGSGVLGKIGQAAGKLGINAGNIPSLITGATALMDARQAGKDSATARRYTDAGVNLAQAEADRANQAWMANQGMRDAYRNVAMNFSDPTNPFARNLAMMGGGGAPAGPAGAVAKATTDGSISKIIDAARKAALSGQGNWTPTGSRSGGGSPGGASDSDDDRRLRRAE